MKKLIIFAALLAVSASAVYAASDAEPWESVNVQRDHKKPARFNREVNFGGDINAAFIDAGVARALVANVTTLTYSFADGGVAQLATGRIAALDAGVANIEGQLRAAGPIIGGSTIAATTSVTGATLVGTTSTTTAALDAGVARFNGSVQIVAGLSSGNCTLGGESPAVCPAQTVLAGSRCVCSNVGTSAAIAALGCAVSLSGSTLTVTSANAATHVVNYHCF